MINVFKSMLTENFVRVVKLRSKDYQKENCVM